MRNYSIKHCAFTVVSLLLAIFLMTGVVAAAGGDIITKGQLEGSVTAIPVAGSDSLYRVESVATGTLSHVGRVTLTWAVPEVELDLLNGQLIVPDPLWRGTLTTPKGDQIFWDYEFPDPVFSFTSLGDLTFETLAEATGGTGRFENVTGHAMAVGKANIFTGEFTVNFLGIGSMTR